MYAISDDYPASHPIGARLVIPLDIFAYSSGQRPEIFSLSQRRQLFFDTFSVELELGSVGIVFDRATSLLSGESVVCFTNPVPDSRRRKRIPSIGARQCGDTFNITVTSKFKFHLPAE